MVWLHGGGYTSGAGSDFDASRLATQGDVDVVTLNYRLGAFGFFAHPQLGRDSDFGLQDQLAALQWVQRNAAAFGGDAKNVTLFGESAGGFSTCALLTSPQTAGLVDRAIVESGSCSMYFPKNGITTGLPKVPAYQPLQQVQAAGSGVAAKLGCATQADQLACLRKIPTKVFVDSGLLSTFATPPYGTTVLPEEPGAVVKAGHALKVPIIVGTNQDEMRFFVGGNLLADKTKFDTGRYEALLKDTFGADAARIEAAYPDPKNNQYSAAYTWATVLTDAGWTCPTITDQQNFSRAGQPVYAFQFTDRTAPQNSGVPAPPGFDLGAEHSNELQFLFGPPPGDAGQQKLGATMVGYWTRFAHTGDPNSPGQPNWPSFRDGDKAQRLQPGGVTPIDVAAQHKCTLWNQINNG